MRRQCNQESFEFHPFFKRQVKAGFDGGAITSDGGRLLLREVEKRTKIVERIAAQIREAWPEARITLRGDSGFCREELMNWCETHGVNYVLGLAGTELAQARCDTLRLKVLKIGAQIRVTVRRVWISLAEGYASDALFAQVHAQLRPLPLRC